MSFRRCYRNIYSLHRALHFTLILKLLTSGRNSNPAEPPWPGLRPGQNPARDSNLRGWDWNPTKPMVFQLRSQIWFQDLMKLKFLTSHHRKNSVRNRVIAKKWICCERNTLHRVQAVAEGECGIRICGAVSFYSLDNFIGYNEWEDYSNHFGEGAEVSRNWTSASFWSLMVSLGTAIAPLNVSFGLWMYYSEDILKVKVPRWQTRQSQSRRVYRLRTI